MKPEKAKPKQGLSDILSGMTKDMQSCYVDMSKVPEDAPHIDSGSDVINLISGIGGFPIGGLVEIAGEYSSGKTTLALACATKVQAKGGTVLFVDFEQAFDPYYAKSLGVSLTSPDGGGNFVLLQPETLEDGWNSIQKMVGTGEVSLVIIDSIAAGTPKLIIEGEAGEGRIGLQASLLAPEYNKLAYKCRKTGCTALLLNQIRIHIEKRGMQMIVTKDTSGGHALKHYCLMRLWMQILQKVEDTKELGTDKTFVANKVRCQLIKNKCGKPYTTGILVIRYGEGIDNESALLDMAIEEEIIMQKGPYFTLVDPSGGEAIKILGREATRERIAIDSEFRAVIEKRLRDSRV
jgi:recombination protein RecA